jgi:hypothetical protein
MYDIGLSGGAHRGKGPIGRSFWNGSFDARAPIFNVVMLRV